MSAATFPNPPIGHRFMGREEIVCRVLGEPVPAVDRFGREMRNVWIEREDTGEQGWYMFGPGAITFTFTPDNPRADAEVSA